MRVFEFDKGKVYISENVIKIFEKFIQSNKRDKEAGGIVLGQLQGSSYYITKASMPSTMDKRSRFGFERNVKSAQLIADYEFENSNGKTVYFGEWHTHPEPIPKPSSVDLNMIKSQYKNGENLPPTIFLVIQGQKDIYVGCYDGKSLIKAIEAPKEFN